MLAWLVSLVLAVPAGGVAAPPRPIHSSGAPPRTQCITLALGRHGDVRKPCGHRVTTHTCADVRLPAPRGDAGPVSAKAVGCRKARQMVRRAVSPSRCRGNGTAPCRVAGFACRQDYVGGGIIGVTCMAGARKVSWLWGGYVAR